MVQVSGKSGFFGEPFRLHPNVETVPGLKVSWNMVAFLKASAASLWALILQPVGDSAGMDSGFSSGWVDGWIWVDGKRGLVTKGMRYLKPTNGSYVLVAGLNIVARMVSIVWLYNLMRAVYPQGKA